MAVPDWIQAIFAIEYSPSNRKELEHLICEWLDETGNYESFDHFVRALVERTRHADNSKGRVHSIRNFSKGDYRNCNALATISAIKGVLGFNKSFEVIIDYQGGMSETGQMKEFDSHVSLVDSNGNNYGERRNYDNTEEQPVKVLTLLYMLGDAYVHWLSEDWERAREIAGEIEKEMGEHGIKSPYLKRRINETRSNF